MAYCNTTDLLTGNIPTPAALDTQKIVNDAADEIDSQIGFVYKTPINVEDVVWNPVVRPVRLLLKRLNVNLATGRLVLAADAAGEEDKLHAYGWSLIREVNAALKSIARGDITLEGAELVDDTFVSPTAPLIYNEDPESSVEAFYNRIANPSYSYAPRYGPGYTDGLVH